MELNKQIKNLTTELTLNKSEDIDKLSIFSQLKIINDEDLTVPIAISKKLDQIEKAVQVCIDKFIKGGRIIYIGAGTSGRIGIIDAVECYPTYGLIKEQIIGVIAGGNSAVFKSIEGAEDDPSLAVNDLQQLNLTNNDVIIGIAASGRTPYVIGAINYANEIGAQTISFSCNTNSEIGKIAQHKIEIEVGAEVISGSTRMKAGTCQKLVLNMISTTVMINLGKVYKNLMVDVKASNQKLVARVVNIFINATHSNETIAHKYIDEANGNLKLAIVMYLHKTSKENAQLLLNKANDKISFTFNN